MKTKALVLTFAVCAGALAAQQQGTAPTPSQELAPIVAVEEQERDLAKAERLYKEAIEGGKLSAEAKHQAMLRLAELLMKLGRRDEAMRWMAKAAESPFADVALDDVTSSGPQDREREEALRGKARELVQKVLAQSVFPYPSATGILDEELRRQIEWLGESVVPEIGAALAAAKPTFANTALRDLSPSTTRIEALRGLAGVLWHLGSPAARAQLEDAYRDGSEAFRALLVTQAARHAPALRELVVKWLNEDPSEAVFWQLARSGTEIGGAILGAAQGWAESRNNWGELPPEVLLGAVERRSPAMRAKVLRNLPTGGGKLVPWSSAAASRACAMVRELANGTDPEVVRTALAALANPRLQVTPEGFDCLVDHLGRIGDDVPLNWVGGPREWLPPGQEHRFAKEAAVRLWPKLAAAARRGVPGRSDYWVRQALQACGPSLDGSMLDDLLALQSRGYTGLLVFLSGRLDPSQALRLVQAFAQMDEGNFEDGARGLFENDLPPEALPLLVSKTEMAVRLQKVDWLATLVARTGNPDAVPWLLAHAEQGGDYLLQLGRRTQAEPVRAAMRKQIDPHAQVPRVDLLLALLSMHDTACLAILNALPNPMQGTRHPYGKGKNAQPIGPLAYLLVDQPDPPHGFTEAEVVDFLRGLFARGGPHQMWMTAAQIDGVSDPLVMVMAAKATGTLFVPGSGAESARQTSWQEVVAQRIAAESDLQGPRHRWLLGLVESSGRWPAMMEHLGVVETAGRWPAVVEHLDARDRTALRPSIEPMLAGDDAGRAEFAFEFLKREQVALDYEALTHSKHARVVELAAQAMLGKRSLSLATALRLMPDHLAPDDFAHYCGENAIVEAVPTLLQLLQHEDSGVRKSASDALTKIRFVHEQKSYWDRITKGLDASPSSAAEKLLLQAKPGAPRAQRLLAIPSLGALGVPEALPFLIEWSQDADAEVAVAASKAIQQIHLNPRR